MSCRVTEQSSRGCAGASPPSVATRAAVPTLLIGERSPTTCISSPSLAERLEDATRAGHAQGVILAERVLCDGPLVAQTRI